MSDQRDVDIAEGALSSDASPRERLHKQGAQAIVHLVSNHPRRGAEDVERDYRAIVDALNGLAKIAAQYTIPATPVVGEVVTDEAAARRWAHEHRHDLARLLWGEPDGVIPERWERLSEADKEATALHAMRVAVWTLQACRMEKR